jgi:ketosteroid isomerase-like protein
MGSYAPIMSESVVERFYTGFAACDAEAMAAEYAPDVTFEDPVFGVLHGADAADMWRMLCAAASDLEVEHRIVRADEREAEVDWTARYTFSATGRPVVNRVRARLRFEGGSIVDHRDSFSMWRWSSQALGPVGRVLGWSPLIRTKVRSTALRGLDAYRRSGA